MVALKVEKFGDQVALVLSEEVQELFRAHVGDIFHFDQTESGELILSLREPSREVRLARGRAFLERYRPTFEALAK